MPKFFMLQEPLHPWGDYGDTLVSGMAERINDELQLKRTGPYIPPISLPGIGEVVVTDSFRRSLEESGLRGLVFEPVKKHHIARSEWHTWNTSNDEPPEFPESGEPEDYVLAKPHSPEAADEMGDLWAIILDKGAQVFRERPNAQSNRYILLRTRSWQGQDIFGSKDVGFIYATDRAKLWLETHAPNQLAFEEASTSDE